MAKIQNTTENVSRSFNKGLNKDSDASFIGEGMWTHARNAVNNNEEGQLGTLSNESSNYLCASAGLTMPVAGLNGVQSRYIIGVIHLFSSNWIIFTAGHNSVGAPVMSEIGLLEEDICRYRPIVQDACLNFDKRFLISGSSREKEDCSYQIYWADGLNPDRFLNIGNPQTWPDPTTFSWLGTPIANPATVNYYTDGTNQILWPGIQWEQICDDNAGGVQTSPGVWPVGHPVLNACITCYDINTLDCPRTRLARLMETPCLSVSLGASGGTLRNGTYFALIAYAIKGQRVTDYFSPSNTQPLWYPNDLQGSLQINISADSANFSEFILVVVQNINQGTVAKEIGLYSTNTNVVELDQIPDTLITVPTRLLPIQTPVFEKSDQITEINNYLLRVGPTSKFDFNYQPLANQIATKWVSTEYPSDYYVKGGNKGSYLRDEVYCFFIRWVYDTGDKSASYHIPGRPPGKYFYNNAAIDEDTNMINDLNTLDNSDQFFEMYNTATGQPIPASIPTTTDDGGIVIASGNMGYWESTEKYPDNQPEIWNASAHCWTGPLAQISTDYDLCGLPIRHHKFPDNYLNVNTVHFNPVSNANTGLKIRLLGVRFENIILPKDNDGIDIPGVVGFEILRGSREGNKSIIAKGMVNNLRTYEIKGTVARGRTGLYPNYPFNCIQSPMNLQNSSDNNYAFNDPYIRMPYKPDDYSIVNNQLVPTDMITFHSPDTMFTSPFLSMTEIKLYGYLQGVSSQQFIEPSLHPKFKLLSNAAVLISVLVGIGEAIISLIGKRVYNQPGGSFTNQSGVSWTYASGAGNSTGGVGTNTSSVPFFNSNKGIYNTAYTNYFNIGGALSDAFLGTDILSTALQTFDDVSASIGTYTAPHLDKELTWNDYIPGPVGVAFDILGGISKFLYYFSEGFDLALRVLYASIRYDQYALQQIGHGFYDDMIKPNVFGTIQRYKIEDSFYIRDNIQEVQQYNAIIPNPLGLPTTVSRSYSINNLKRSDTVVVRTKTGDYFSPLFPNGINIGPDYIKNAAGQYVDQSLVTLSYFENNQAVNNGWGWGSAGSPNFDNFSVPFGLPIASYYAGLKIRLRNQYGQLQSIKQIAITPCEQKLSNYAVTPVGPYNCATDPGVQYFVNYIQFTPTFFGGDTFINRYTEKNSMFFFYDWLYGQPDGFEYNYLLHQMVPEPRFWVNSKAYDSTDFAPNFSTFTPGTGNVPTDFYNLDNKRYQYADDSIVDYPGVFRVKDSFFYLAVSSVRDFFVESDVLVDFRIAGITEAEKFYDPYRYTNLNAMFDINPEIITRGNEYRYDYSLSISKAFSQYFSAGNLQSRNYDPFVAQLCYTYYPDRLYYSLPQQNESFKDSWFVYLPNNYNEFTSQISGVKSINKSGLFITFKNASPLMYQGVDVLQTDLATKITIGDGGLFSQPGQSVTNADVPYEYGSSQNRLSVLSTPGGLFYISQNQGKIFSYSGGLKEISQNGLKWWFNLFLPYVLTLDFPTYPYLDNPVAGIGCQTLYDNENSIIFFSKKDYKLLDKWKVYGGQTVIYVPLNSKGSGDYFQIQNPTQPNGNPGAILPGKYLLGDPLIFENASWTISFDPKNDFWISFHDWHPDLVIPNKGKFITTKANTIWKHNDTCNSFCKFYDQNYPFEIEFPIITGQTVTTVKSIEYILECYRISKINCVDQHHVLDFNFDTAIIFNSEQASGYLNLNLFPKNNVTLSLDYPKLNVNQNSFDILFSKEENKYRFNQFWDITRDRGEFPIGSNYPPTGPVIPGSTILNGNYDSQNIWETSSNGYTKILNPLNLDYNKSQTQRKKFRHYLNFLNLKRDISGDINMVVKIVNSKNQISQR